MPNIPVSMKSLFKIANTGTSIKSGSVAVASIDGNYKILGISLGIFSGFTYICRIDKVAEELNLSPYTGQTVNFSDITNIKFQYENNFSSEVSKTFYGEPHWQMGVKFLNFLPLTPIPTNTTSVTPTPTNTTSVTPTPTNTTSVTPTNTRTPTTTSSIAPTPTLTPSSVEYVNAMFVICYIDQFFLLYENITALYVRVNYNEVILNEKGTIYIENHVVFGNSCWRFLEIPASVGGSWTLLNYSGQYFDNINQCMDNYGIKCPVSSGTTYMNL